MKGSRCHVRDRVTVEGLQTGAAPGVVTQVRRHQDGTFRYGVRLDKEGS